MQFIHTHTNLFLQILPFQVILNQTVLGPCVIAVIFAWNNLWLGKLSELPSKYQNDALPTLLNGNSSA
jgi:protein Mpv17